MTRIVLFLPIPICCTAAIYPAGVDESPFSLSSACPFGLTALQEMLAKHPPPHRVEKNGGQALNLHLKQTHVSKQGKHPRIHRATPPFRQSFNTELKLSQPSFGGLLCSRFAYANIYNQVNELAC